jgi:hypothetical protein
MSRAAESTFLGGSPILGAGVMGPRVLVACEYSATVRDAFRARGFDAWSCDLLPTEGDPRWHVQGSVFLRRPREPRVFDYLRPCDPMLLEEGWDLLIAHPPCTDLAVSGARHFAAKVADGRQARALEFVQRLLDAPVPHIALENPVSIISSRIRKPDQIIQPWQFGHGETKATCLWLKNLPKLVPTDVVEGRSDRIHKMPPGPNRWKERSRTYAGSAAAMADQWGDYLLAKATPRVTASRASGAEDQLFHKGMD